MKNKGIIYGSIESAHEVIYLTEGKDIRTGKYFPLARSINETAKQPPNAYSRKISLFKINSYYTLLDVNKTKNNGGLILGWIYPYNNKIIKGS